MTPSENDLTEHEQQHSALPHHENSYKWKALTTVALGSITVTMDWSITNISLPILNKVFDTGLTTTMWVTLVFTVVGTSLMLVLGRIGDYFGRKPIYEAGMLVFTLGMAGCSLSQSIGQLIAFRAFQAAGAAMTISCGQAIITESFPPEEMGRGLGLFGVSISVGFIIGPILGGFLLSWLDWRSIYYTRIPVGLITLFMSLALLRKGEKRLEKIDLDVMGALTSSGGIFCFVFGVSQVSKFGLKSPLVYLLVGIGLSSLAAFTFIERKAKDPIVDLSIFKNRDFSYAIGSLFLSFVATPFFVLCMPFFAMQGIGFSSDTTGLLFSVVSMATILGGPVSGWLTDRFGPVWFSTLGAAAIAAAFFFMRGFGLQTTVGDIVPVLVLLGIGIGTYQAPNSSSIMGAVTRDRLGTASALTATGRQVGISVGMAVAGTTFSTRRLIHETELGRQGMEALEAASLSVSNAFHDGLLVGFFLQLLVVVLCLIPGRKK